MLQSWNADFTLSGETLSAVSTQSWEALQPDSDNSGAHDLGSALPCLCMHLVLAVFRGQISAAAYQSGSCSDQRLLWCSQHWLHHADGSRHRRQLRAHAGHCQWRHVLAALSERMQLLTNAACNA